VFREDSVKTTIVAGAVALALAAGTTTSAMAFEQAGGFHSDRFAGVRGYSAWRHGDLNGRRASGGYSPGPHGYAYGSPHYDGRSYHGSGPVAGW
jgi:hypothetical protein